MAVHVLGTLPPLIQVGISVSRGYLSRGLGGPPVVRTALIDTGSSMTAIDPSIAAALRPLRLGTLELTRPGGTAIRVSTYDIRLAFEPDPQHSRWWQQGRWFDLEASETPPASAGVDALIGQDLLHKVVMAWDGPRWRLPLMHRTRRPMGKIPWRCATYGKGQDCGKVDQGLLARSRRSAPRVGATRSGSRSREKETRVGSCPIA
jgi:hypothetical protein